MQRQFLERNNSTTSREWLLVFIRVPVSGISFMRYRNVFSAVVVHPIFFIDETPLRKRMMQIPSLSLKIF